MCENLKASVCALYHQTSNSTRTAIYIHVTFLQPIENWTFVKKLGSQHLKTYDVHLLYHHKGKMIIQLPQRFKLFVSFDYPFNEF